MNRLKFDSFARKGEAYHAGATVMEGDQTNQPHTHDFHEVFWISSGTGVHELNGNPLPLSPGSLGFIRPSDAHKFSAPGGSLCIRNIAFRAQSAAIILQSLKEGGCPAIFDGKTLGASVMVSSSVLQHLDTAFDRLAILPRRSVHLHAFLFDVVDRLVSGWQERRDLPAVPEWLARGVESLAAPGAIEAGLAGFYWRCGRCREHVARACRRHYGLSPSDLLNQHRLKRAASLLATTEDGILGIALECGWNHLGHFYDLFKNAYKIPPGQFRQMARRTLPAI